MQKEFVSYEIALALKELGFNEPCCANMFDYTKPHININVPNRIRYFMPNYSENFNKEYDFGVVGHKDIFVSIPIYQQELRWFREKYDLHYIVCKNIQIDGYGYRKVIQISYMEENENTVFKTYEEAELACLKELIEIVKKQNETT